MRPPIGTLTRTLICALVASLALGACGESEADKQDEKIAAHVRESTAKYIREHRDLYAERFSKITCVDIMFVGWNCQALFDGGRSCYVFAVGGRDYGIVQPLSPPPGVGCSRPQPAGVQTPSASSAETEPLHGEALRRVPGVPQPMSGRPRRHEWYLRFPESGQARWVGVLTVSYVGKGVESEWGRA
jgi:hypothetical protein